MEKMTSPYKWGMVIDLDRCTGCGACVVACQAENNVAICEKKEIAEGRNMHWLRIERFWVGEYPEVRVRFLPVLCQHCHDAPCEPVCPVYASYHNPDGLNGQVYNRCVGTRYCGNNCPYAVRVFNFHDHEHAWPSPLENQLSPDITIRKPWGDGKVFFLHSTHSPGQGRSKGGRTDGQRRGGTAGLCTNVPTRGAGLWQYV